MTWIHRLFQIRQREYTFHCRISQLRMCSTVPDAKTRGIVLGCFQEENDKFSFTDTAKGVLSKALDLEKFESALAKTKFSGKVGSTRVFYDALKNYDCVVLTGLGKKNSQKNQTEMMDMNKENVRRSISAALKACKELELTTIEFDDCSEPKAVGEAVELTKYTYNHLKSDKKSFVSEAKLIHVEKELSSAHDMGTVVAQCQNFARYLSDSPANHMTPIIAAEKIQQELGPHGVDVIIRDENWIREKKMGLFLSVAQGSEQPPRLVEMHYNGVGDGKEDLIVLVGKGITFDAGGISIKPSASMHEMKADMQGGSCVAAAVLGAARLKLKCNIIGLIPFTENMPSGKATKPGDVHTSMNGKSVEIQNTDAEGRLVLADALEYAQTFSPKQIIDLATLTGAICVALGGTCSAIYTNDQKMFKDFESASFNTGDRIWRMPLFEYYKNSMKSNVADLNNINGTLHGASCSAAGFLKDFVKFESWAHLDIACSMISKGEISYLENNFMTGRPTRTLIEYLVKQQQSGTKQ